MSRRLEKNNLAVWKKTIKTNYCLFCSAFLANVSNYLSYIMYRKFPICFALRFLANLSNNLSYIIYRKFPILHI